MGWLWVCVYGLCIAKTRSHLVLLHDHFNPTSYEKLVGDLRHYFFSEASNIHMCDIIIILVDISTHKTIHVLTPNTQNSFRAGNALSISPFLVFDDNTRICIGNYGN